jgi:hypothetical protein
MPIQYRLRGVGIVSVEEIEARFSAYLNAGAPEPALEGSVDERTSMLEELASRGDRQMKSLMARYLKRIQPQP